jgi:DNA-directed RNA polymerase subunit alpha
MAKYRIVLDFETDDDITLGMITRGLEYNENEIRNAMFSEYPNVVGDCAVSYKIVEARETTVKRSVEELLDRKVDFSLFSIRAVNCLLAADIETVRDLVKHKKSDLVQFRNFGKKTLDELDKFLEYHDLHWGMDV